MAKKFKIYLAHSHEMLAEGKVIQFTLEHCLGKGFEIINPFEDGDQSQRKLWLAGTRTYDVAKAIVTQDLLFITKADAVIALLFNVPNNILIGTPMEVFFGKFCLANKPVIAVYDHGEHPWLMSLGAIRVKTLFEAMKVVKSLAENTK